MHRTKFLLDYLSVSKTSFQMVISGMQHATIFLPTTFPKHIQYSRPLYTVSDIGTSCFSFFFFFPKTSSITFYLYNRTQHHDCLSGETVCRYALLSPLVQLITLRFEEAVVCSQEESAPLYQVPKCFAFRLGQLCLKT